MEEQRDSDTSQIQKATTENVPSKWIARERTMTGRRLYLQSVPRKLGLHPRLCFQGSTQEAKKGKVKSSL